MKKRSIQTSKPGITIGIEYDQHAIRIARLATDGRGGFTIDKLDEIKGDFSEDVGILDGFRQVKNIFGVGMRDSVILGLTGKQVFASQIPFRKLGAEEMEQALRLELRKTVHFEVATSTLDFEIVSEEDDSNGGVVQVLVALASNTLLKRNLTLLERAGIKTNAVDVMPIAVANALWTWAGADTGNHPLLALHVGPQISTIVIDGDASPFFNRNVYFAAEDVFGPKASAPDRDKRIQSLADEVTRSLHFYEKNSGVSSFQEIVLLGDYLDGENLAPQLKKVSGLPVTRMDLAGKMGYGKAVAQGQFDMAIALALRGEL